MELKLFGSDEVSKIKWFQSYLYGIEMSLRQRKKDHVQMFQSYLYGIEMSKAAWVTVFGR